MNPEINKEGSAEEPEQKQKIEIKPTGESFEEMETLIKEGWKLGPHVFENGERGQVYRVVMTKEGEEDREFYVAKPYRMIVDSLGKLKEG